MKSITKVAAITTLAITAASAQAQLYGEVGYNAIRDKFTDAGTNYKADVGALSGTIGYGLHENLALEAMAAFGVQDDTVSGVKVELTHAYGLFVKPRVMLGSNFELFGRLGYVHSKTKGSAGGISASDKSSDWAYGLGGNYYFTPTTYGTLSYTRFQDKDNEKIEGIALGVGMKF